MLLLSQVPVAGQKVCGAVITIERQLTTLGDSDLTALTVLRLESLSEDALPELTAILTALPTSLVWLSLPPALPASAARAMDFMGLKHLAILEMR
jgi:hypothetical protein